MGPGGLVPRALVEALAAGIGFDHHRMAQIGGLKLGQRHPHRFGNAGRIDQAVAVAGFEQDDRAIIVEFKDRGKVLRAPSTQFATDLLAAHPDLVKRGLDLVEWQQAGVAERQPRTQEDRGRRSVRLTREKGQTIEDRIDFARRRGVKPMHETHVLSSLLLTDRSAAGPAAPSVPAASSSRPDRRAAAPRHGNARVRCSTRPTGAERPVTRPAC